MARTLHDAHARGLGHWRLNPENIFLTAMERPKIHGSQRGAVNTFVVRDLGALLVSILNGRPSPSAWRSATHDAPSVPPGEPWRIETDDVPRVLAGHPSAVIAIIQSLLTEKLGDAGMSLLAVAREMEQRATAAAAAEETRGGVT